MRTKLPPRRPSVTCRLDFAFQEGQSKHILITIGYDEVGHPKEVFCADFKAGTTLHAIVQDACILFSRLLQHSDSLDELVDSMCSQPQSLIGQIACEIKRQGRMPPFADGDTVPHDVPPDLLRSGAETQLAE